MRAFTKLGTCPYLGAALTLALIIASHSAVEATPLALGKAGQLTEGMQIFAEAKLTVRVGSEIIQQEQFDLEYLVFGYNASTRVYHVALFATRLARDDQAQKQRLIYQRYDDDYRLVEVFGYWQDDAFGELWVPPVLPKKFKKDGATQHLQRVSDGVATYESQLSWTLQNENALSFVAKSQQETPGYRGTQRLPRTQKQIQLNYSIDANGVASSWQSSVTQDRDGQLRKIEVQVKLKKWEMLPEEMHFQRRAELGTVERQMRWVHGSAELDQLQNWASMLRDRLEGAPFNNFAMDQFEDMIEAARPENELFKAQQLAIEDFYGKKLPLFEASDIFSQPLKSEGKKAYLVCVISSAEPFCERLFEFLIAKAASRPTLAVIALSPDADSAGLLAWQKKFDLRFQIFANQKEYLKKLGIQRTPVLMVVGKEGKLRSAYYGFDDSTPRTVSSILQPLLK